MPQVQCYLKINSNVHLCKNGRYEHYLRELDIVKRYTTYTSRDK